MIRLPSDFIDKMNAYLGEDEAKAFWKSYEEPRTHGLRLNPLKIADDSPMAETLTELFGLSPVPWCPGGYYYSGDVRPGKHPYHAAGLYYIQEPSAMSAVELLGPEPGDTVLDLAAAPGGKSTHIAGKLQGRGLLVANEIHPARAKILSENIERMGIYNCVVTNSSPQQLAQKFPLFFDKIMVDAPCSGEGMFRKDPEAVKEWSLAHVAMCAARQMDILEQAALMLKPGGRLAYSTCTFSPEENERIVEAFTAKYPQFSLQRMERIWPHLHKGEGHFVAVLQNERGSTGGDAAMPVQKPQRAKASSSAKPLRQAVERFREFAAEALPGFEPGPGEAILFGEHLYWLPHADKAPFHADLLHGLKVLRPGLHLAEMKKNRVEPAHALALAVRSEQAAQCVSFTHDSPEVQSYLKGEIVEAEHRSGWVVVTVDGYPLGWGKCSGGVMKNHYPKGLRWSG